MRNEYGIAVLGRSGTDRNKSAGLKDLVKCAAIHHKVFDNRECRTPERFYRDCSSILEVTHEKLAGGHMVIRTMGAAVDVEGACSADSLAAVMVERNRTAALAPSFNCYRIIAFTDKLLVQDVKHLEERSVLFNT